MAARVKLKRTSYFVDERALNRAKKALGVKTRSRVLQGFWRNRYSIQLKKSAVEGYLVFDQSLRITSSALTSRSLRCRISTPKDLNLVSSVTLPHTEKKSASGQIIDGRRVLSDHKRTVKRKDKDRGSEVHSRNLASR